MIPAQLAGVLAGKTATAPRPWVPLLEKEDPRTTWVENKRFVRDGKLWTSGTLLNGLELMTAFTRTYWPDLAEFMIRLGGLPDRPVEYLGDEGRTDLNLALGDSLSSMKIL